MAEKTMLEKVIEATEKLGEALTEGRAMLKDLRAERRFIEKTVREARELVNEQIEERVQKEVIDAVEKSMTNLGAEIISFNDRAHEKVIRNYEALTNTLMYGHPEGEDAVPDDNQLEKVIAIAVHKALNPTEDLRGMSWGEGDRT